MAPRVLTPEERASISSHNLRERTVQVALAGYLAQELARFHRFTIDPEALIGAIDKYVWAMDNLLDRAEELRAKGFSPSRWPTDNSH